MSQIKSIAFPDPEIQPEHIYILEETCRRFNSTIKVHRDNGDITLTIESPNSSQLAEVYYWIGSILPFPAYKPVRLAVDLLAGELAHNEIRG